MVEIFALSLDGLRHLLKLGNLMGYLVTGLENHNQMWDILPPKLKVTCQVLCLFITSYRRLKKKKRLIFVSLSLGSIVISVLYQAVSSQETKTTW